MWSTTFNTRYFADRAENHLKTIVLAWSAAHINNSLRNILAAMVEDVAGQGFADVPGSSLPS
jgi:hypothetical protein